MITTEEFSRKLVDKCLSLKKEDLLEVMLDAIDLMQQYNGKSIARCVIESLKQNAKPELKQNPTL